jgi:hypothetical protein
VLEFSLIMDVLKVKKSWLLATLVSLPIIYLAVLLVQKTVNVPFWDQWELVPIINDYKTGHLSLHDLWQQHNEHRIFFPRIVMMLLAIITHWNTRVEAFAGFLIAVLGFIIFCLIFRQAQKKLTIGATLLTALFSVIWFSPVQYDNWLWGWQIQWFLCVLGVMIVTYSIGLIVKERGVGAKSLVFLLAGGILAQYSLGGGILIWPIAIAALCYLRISKKNILLSSGVAVLTTALYYFNYQNPQGPSKSLAIHQPVNFIKYFFIYLGRPLSYFHRLTFVLGFLTFSAFMALVIYLFLKKPEEFKKLLPWVMLGLFAICSAVITDLSRLGFGVSQAYSGRYATISSLLLISTIMLAYYNLTDIKRLIPRYFNLLRIFVLTALVILVAINFSWGINGTDKQSRYLTDIQHCTHQPNPYEICLLSAYPTKSKVVTRLNYLKSIHWGGY